MKLYIGFDLGTSAMKLLLMGADGTIHNTVTKEYPLEFPQPGWSQQNPEDWKKALFEGMPELLNGFDASQVAGIGCGGAMLSMVACGEYDSVKACCEKLCAVADVVKPEPELVAKYEARYQQFKKIYPAVKALFPEIQ